MILGAIRDRILTSTEVTDLISRRLHPGNLPDREVIPAADMRIVGGTGEHFLDGSLGAYMSTITVDCYSYDVLQADTIAMAIIRPGLVVGYRGVQSGVNISGVKLSSGIRQYVEGVDPGSDRYRYVSSITIQVNWGTSC